MRRKLYGRGLECSFQWVKPNVGQPPLLTVVFAVQSRLDDVIELKNECALCCKEPTVAADVLDIRPYNPISPGGFRSGGAPDFGVFSLCSCPRIATNVLSVSCNVKVASRSYWVPFEVT